MVKGWAAKCVDFDTGCIIRVMHSVSLVAYNIDTHDGYGKVNFTQLSLSLSLSLGHNSCLFRAQSVMHGVSLVACNIDIHMMGTEK